MQNEFEKFLVQTTDRILQQVPPNLAESIRYSLLAPGKRIRPRLLLASAGMVGLPAAPALLAATALEMVHCFTLIHDDLPCMDNDDFRRGRPSNHKKFGEAVALLAGDGLMGAAFAVFSEALPDLTPANYSRGVRRFCDAIGPAGVIGGQAAELLMSPSSSFEDLSRMHAGKTGALFMASILIPADFAGVAVDTPAFQSIDTFARQLGLAFQVADDLADAKQDEGKPLSILYFKSPEQARTTTLEALQAATAQLQANWGVRADPLVEISRQVAASLGTG